MIILIFYNYDINELVAKISDVSTFAPQLYTKEHISFKCLLHTEVNNLYMHKILFSLICLQTPFLLTLQTTTQISVTYSKNMPVQIFLLPDAEQSILEIKPCPIYYAAELI